MKALVVAVTLAAELLIVSSAPACQCGSKDTDAEALVRAERAFVGKRISSVTVLRTHFGSTIPVQRYVFAVGHALKGPLGNYATVMTTGGNCDSHFTDSAHYLVYLVPTDRKGEFRSTICLPSRRISTGDPFLAPSALRGPVATTWRYALEPLYRGSWASAVCLVALATQPLGGDDSFYDPHRWLLTLSRFALLGAPLLALLICIPAVRRRFGTRPLALAPAALLLASLLAIYLYVRTNIWLSYLLA